MSARVDATLDEMIEDPEANPQVGALWVRRRAAQKRWALREKLMALHQRGEIGRRAINTYVGCLGSAGQTEPLLHLLEEHGTWLAQDGWGWEAVAVALGATEQWDRLLGWAGDWRSHLTAHPAALHNVFIALQKRKRDVEAAELACAASDIGGIGRGYEALFAWGAFEHAMAGNIGKARTVLAKMDRDAFDDYTHRIQRFARAAVAVQNPERVSRQQAWKEARALVDRAIQGVNIYKSDRPFREAFLRTNQCVGRITWRPWRTLWALSKTYDPLLSVIPVALGAIGLLLFLAVAIGGAATGAGAVGPALIMAIVFFIRAASRRS